MTESDENQLTARQQQALYFFVGSSSIESACREADISKETFYQWLKKPSFKSELERLRNEVVNDAVNHLKSSSTKAVTTLESLLSRDDSPAVQRAAANDILGHVVKFMELREFEERLLKLENNMMNK